MEPQQFSCYITYRSSLLSGNQPHTYIVVLIKTLGYKNDICLCGFSFTGDTNFDVIPSELLHEKED